MWSLAFTANKVDQSGHLLVKTSIIDRHRIIVCITSSPALFQAAPDKRQNHLCTTLRTVSTPDRCATPTRKCLLSCPCCYGLALFNPCGRRPHPARNSVLINRHESSSQPLNDWGILSRPDASPAPRREPCRAERVCPIKARSALDGQTSVTLGVPRSCFFTTELLG